MNKYIKTTLVFAGIWFMAGLMNGLLCGIAIMLLEPASNLGLATVGLSVILSFVFSAPVVGFVWFVTVIAQAANRKGPELFQFVLQTTLFTASVVALIFINTLGTEFLKARYVSAFCIVISALTAVLMFRNKIKIHE